MECRKCGAQLHQDQKVCIQCGTRTVAGGGFYVEEEKPWRPSRNMIIAAVGIVLLIVIAFIVKGSQTIPPEVVAEKWFRAMSQRQFGMANKYMTPNVETDLSSRMMDLRGVCDEYYDCVIDKQAKCNFAKPKFTGPKKADIAITLSYASSPARVVSIEMVKVGRQWQVNKIY